MGALAQPLGHFDLVATPERSRTVQRMHLTSPFAEVLTPPRPRRCDTHHRLGAERMARRLGDRATRWRAPAASGGMDADAPAALATARHAACRGVPGTRRVRHDRRPRFTPA